jgi:hypothetical protein
MFRFQHRRGAALRVGFQACRKPVEVGRRHTRAAAVLLELLNAVPNARHKIVD